MLFSGTASWASTSRAVGEHRHQMRGDRAHPPCPTQRLAVHRHREQPGLGGGQGGEIRAEAAVQLGRAPALLTSGAVTCGDGFQGYGRDTAFRCRAGTGFSRTMKFSHLIVMLELPVPALAVLPVESVAETLDRWRAGERVEVLRSDFLDILASVPDPRDARGRRYLLAGLLAIAILATAAGMRGYAGFASWAATAPAEVLAR